MQSKSVKISIIMPVYNVKDYLEKAVKSVLSQSLNDFEFFLVDDGSTDGSEKICDSFASLDSRIRVIHQKNQGAHNARNNALKEANGQYVCFFDSDDYINENMLKDLYSIAEEYSSDLVVSGFNIITYYNENQYLTLKYIPDIELDIYNYNNKNNFRTYAYKNFDKNMFYPPWNKLYKLSYLKNNNITFPITYRDDFPFVLNVIKDIENVTFTKSLYYNFIRKRADSETQKFVSNLYEKREEEHKLMLELYKYWNLLDDANSFEMISRRYIDRLIECMVNLFNKEARLNKKEKKDKISEYLNNNNVDNCIKKAKPQKLYLKIMYLPIRSKSVKLCYIMSKFICFIKGKNIKLFSKLKTNR